MTSWIRTHPYTITASLILAALIAWCAYHPRPWWQYAAAVMYGVAYGGMNAPRRHAARHREEPPWRPPGRSRPCPPECRIQVEHRHYPAESVR